MQYDEDGVDEEKHFRSFDLQMAIVVMCNGLRLILRYPLFFEDESSPELGNFIASSYAKQFTIVEKNPSEIQVMLAFAEQLFKPLFSANNIVFENRHTDKIRSRGETR